MSLLLTAWLGCAAGDPSTEPTGEGLGPLMVELGSGEWEWESLDDGGEIPVIQGPQGGFHLLGSVRVSGIEAGSADDLGDPLNPTTTFSVWVDGENIAPSSQFIQGLDQSSANDRPFRHEMIGRFVIMNITGGDELDGVELELSVAVKDVHGTETATSLLLTAYPHPLNL
jgi:hypothetical protein